MRRLWGIRHLRWQWHSIRVWRWARRWGRLGIGLGVPSMADLDHLEAIWRGNA